MRSSVIAILTLLMSAAPVLAFSRENPGVFGNVRVQFLSPTLVRLELKGPKRFEDRNTFTVVNRPKALGIDETSQTAQGAVLRHGRVEVDIPDSSTLKGVQIKLNGLVVYTCDGTAPKPDFFPAPGSMPSAIAIADNPRIIPAKWGATAPPATNKTRVATSGWDLSNQSLDIYVFLPTSYEQFRQEFLSLTGPTEMLPLYAFGLWQSRYHPYTEQEALGVIDRYRADDIPLDSFVVDTDWRVNASDGYDINVKDFPDMKRFISEAHSRNVHVMYNDHPAPVATTALDPKELQFRENGLASLLNMGADVWWYDRNWHTALVEPAPGLPKEVWGGALYHDITQKVVPGRRPMVMSNVPGIDNGLRHYAPHPATHRYPMWWTGDTKARFEFLQYGVENAVDGGVESLLPYMSEDISGHYGNPTSEVYARYFEYGSLSPFTRLHCTVGETRYPWDFGAEDEGIVRDYTKMRYRLLPTIYAVARENYETGMPIVRRCDLYWPNLPDAKRNDQYLLGENILVAPILTSMYSPPVVLPTTMLHTPDGQPGVKGEYFANMTLSGDPTLTRVDPDINFDWGTGSPAPNLPKDLFSVRWTAKIGPLPATGDYTFQTTTDDGVRLWVDGKLLVDQWRDMSNVDYRATITLEAGKTYDLRMEYYEDAGGSDAMLKWIPANAPSLKEAARQVWIPPGEWMDLWDRSFVSGPKMIDASAGLSKTPMWQREGSIVLLAPDMSFTYEKPWDPITLQICSDADDKFSQTLYEDDGISNDYKKRGFCKTEIEAERKGKELRVHISPARGNYPGKPRERAWSLRLYLAGSPEIDSVSVDGKATSATEVEGTGMPFSDRGAKALRVDLPRKSTRGAREVVIRLR